MERAKRTTKRVETQAEKAMFEMILMKTGRMVFTNTIMVASESAISDVWEVVHLGHRCTSDILYPVHRMISRVDSHSPRWQNPNGVSAPSIEKTPSQMETLPAWHDETAVCNKHALMLPVGTCRLRVEPCA